MNSRERKSILAWYTRRIQKVAEGRWAVQGRKKADGRFGDAHLVTLENGMLVCRPCPGFEKSGDCQHVGAVEKFLAEGEPELRDDLYPEKRPTYPQDNVRYKEARRVGERAALLMINDVARAIFRVPNPDERRQGRQFTDLADLVTCVCIRTLHMKSGDRAQGYVTEAWQNGLLRRGPSNSKTPPCVEAIGSNMTRPRVLKALYKVVRALQPAIDGEDIALDGCDYETPIIDEKTKVPKGPPEHIRRKLRIQTMKLNLAVGVKSKIIVAARVSIAKKHESNKAIPLMVEATLVRSDIPRVIADKGYLGTQIFEWIQAHGMAAVIPPKSSTKADPGSVLGAHTAWWNSTPPAERGYGPRQAVEAANSADKRGNGERLRSRKNVSQASELVSHVLVTNARRLARLFIEGEIDDIPYLGPECRKMLEASRKRVQDAPRPDKTPRYRDGLKAA